ncbi:MFS transporter [Oceanospirillum linum]|uniref:Major facilitator superfamily (MFS) profile domain-containing protein n=1 Tax=Oceanospirillum linum TaxID=966 RepID=A0A1T1HG99_OCELI|nr:MFS transporter [Oceanospirillum linum]OOV88884.1 hypothetical protein BTA35_0200975 [Oceanospirillum linum]SEF45031.1 Predicted arabinose efflux permease, MFS family [Oleiphilus messinensis]SMP01668.1 Predicted arabinose efflux permease, MFS family [Oceanospirillum linum]
MYSQPPDHSLRSGAAPGEWRVVILVTLIQFINIVDFMMVMPLGPDFARDLNIPMSDLGLIGGSYTFAAAASGFILSQYLDRFDRRAIAMLALAGLSLSTFAATLATDQAELMLARICAGAFGGPASAIGMAMIIDVVPTERRGRAMAIAMGSFSVAAVAGIPFGLELANWHGWQTPFYGIALSGISVLLAIFLLLPKMDRHKGKHKGKPATGVFSLLNKSLTRWALMLVVVSMFGNFLLVPNLSAYIQFNLGFPRERIGELYMIGGGASLIGMQVTGYLTDRFGSLGTGTVVCLGLALVLWFGFMQQPELALVPFIFAGFMVFSSARRVAQNALTSQTPEAHERAAYTSAQFAFQHVSTGIAAVGSSWVLTADEHGVLQGMVILSTITLIFVLAQPVMMWVLKRKLDQRPAMS